MTRTAIPARRLGNRGAGGDCGAACGTVAEQLCGARRRERAAREDRQICASVAAVRGHPTHPDHARRAWRGARPHRSGWQASVLHLGHHGHPERMAARRAEGLPNSDDRRRGPDARCRSHSRRTHRDCVSRCGRPGVSGALRAVGRRRPAQRDPPQAEDTGGSTHSRPTIPRRSTSAPTTSKERPTATRSIATTSVPDSASWSSTSRGCGA